MGSELDSSVDTIRHHQTNYEAQKRRTAMEINHLRNQLAKTTVLLDQFKLFFSKANLNTTSLNQNIRVLIPSLLKSIHTNNELQDVDALSIDELKLKLHVTQNELDQLRLDMVHQREDGDREASKLRGQLAEVSSDARALRIQLNRLISQGISSSKLNGLESTNSSDSSSCINCQKLQRLNDVLQRKQSKMNSFPDLINHQGNVMNHENFVCENSAFTQKVTHRENVVSSSVQTDLLSAIPTTNCIQKVDVATDPTNEYTNILPHLPISKCECIQTESLLMGNDIMPSETSLAGEISLISEIIRYGDVGEPICLNESQLHSSHVSSKHAEVSLRKSDEATINDHRNSSTDFKSIYNVNGSQNVSEESFHSQLLHRLKGAEEEAIMAMDQLRASNAEFLTLKERLSHATVERAHLKATIEGLDEQVALLEDSLYERTQELHKYQMLLGEYCPTYQKQISPHSVISEVSLRKSDEATINDHRNSSTDFKSIYNVNGSQNVSEESFHSQLLHRLKGAEEEAIMAMDQLRASNAEFLTLKERLSHATVERAHLKATIEGLDEQVALLEDSLYERTQELHKYQMLLGEYCPTYQKQISPHSVISEVS
ncbi:Ubiquinone biosynthesis O-methyltransferase [Schistosoma japonicum]|uniref:Ubiquinone biosynthesis O-methyltransferase n=1 Tax=Schistosoma japonicum TaxID=6182 RepID=A0A4Z2DJZ0_SCHJA|nr:Ubiquinone biosynthesis O-methyltransferase [Schistosoma japonicum]